MAEIYRNLLIIICLGLLGWGIVRTERIYQYPFFMGCIFLSFIVPQAFALIQTPGLASQQAVERVLLMSCLCAAACWVGYQMPLNSKWLAIEKIKIDDRKLTHAGLALLALGSLCWFLLERQAAIGIETASNHNWTGPATIYWFFGQSIYIAWAIFLLKALGKPNPFNICLTIIAGRIPLNLVLGGRRQPTITFAIIIGLSLFLVWKIKPSRTLILMAVFLMIFVIPTMGLLRNRFWDLLLDGQWQELLDKSQEAFTSQQEGDILELRNAALYMDATEKQGLYGLGAGWWDAIIFQYIPGQIVGFGLKNALQFKLITEQNLANLYGYYVHPGTTFTGVGDAFMEFGYLGCLAFAVMGYIFKHLWILSNYPNSTLFRVLYMGLFSPAMVSVTHGVGRFFQEAIFQAGLVGLAAYYAKVKD
jgi:hypothetical protein